MKRPRPGKQRAGYWMLRTASWGMVFSRRHKSEPWLLRAAMRILGPSHCWRPELYERFTFVPPRPTAPEGPGENRRAAKPTGMLQKLPLLAAVLLDTRYDDSGELRMPGYLIIRPSSGAWQVTLKEPTTGLQLRVSTESLDLAWGALEALLAQPVVPWEVDAWARTPAGKKRSK